MLRNPYFYSITNLNNKNMKTNLLSIVSAAIMLAAPSFTMAQTQTKTKDYTATADTYLRKGKADNNGAKEQMEIGTNDSKGTDFVGLLKFTIDGEAVGKVEKATLRIVSERVKGNPQISLYSYSNEWESDAKYEDQTANIEAARATEAIATFTPKGTKGRSILSDTQDNVSTDIADWTNEIDITEYVKTLTDGTFSLMLAETNNQKDNQKYFASEAKDFSPKKDASITITSAQIVPLLTIEYNNVSNGISGVGSEAGKSAKEIYTLQGVQVKAMTAPGIYIVGGKKIVKK